MGSSSLDLLRSRFLAISAKRDIRTGLYLVAAACGLIDATCVLALGGVFAEMMTGNLLFMGITLGSGGSVANWGRFLWPLLCFSVGATLGGWLLRRRVTGEKSRSGFLLVWLIIAVAALICWMQEPKGNPWLGQAITALLAGGMGVQTALLRRHGVSDLATTVMTMTLTAILAEFSFTRGKPAMLRRLISIAAFFSGGAIAAALVPFGTFLPLGLATLVYTLAIIPLLHGDKPEDELSTK